MIIYKTTNLVNGKIYIGQDKNNNLSYLGSGKILHLAFRKYGLENFNKEILEVCESIEELNEREKYWISFYDSTNRSIGYNISLGGNGGDTLSKHPNKEEIGKRIGESNKKLWEDEAYKTNMSEIRKNQITEETREKLSKLSNGENNGMHRKSHKVEAKDKMSEARKNWWNDLSDDERKKIGKKISEANTGKPGNNWTDEQKKTHSEWMKYNPPFKGKTHTDEVKQRISEANKKPKTEETKRKLSEANRGKKPGNMIKVEVNGIVYDSLTEASLKTEINMSTLRNRIKSKNKKYINYKIYESVN
jgi:group I intron endonuclease